MHISDPVPQLPGHLRIYQTLIDRLLAKNPDERFADARELMGTVGQGQYASPDQPTQGRSETLARAEAVFTTEILPETKDPAATEIISAAAEARLAGAKSRGNRRQWGISVGVLLVLAALGWGWSVHARQQVQKQWYAAQTSAGQLPVAGQGWTELLTGMEFVWVPGGCFQMGSTDGVSDINLVHEVCVDGYWMGKTEVTQVQWQKIMGGNPSSFKSGTNYPVESVSWDDAQDYIRKLGTQSGKSFRLPTEAEWEYAARSGGKDEKYAGGGNLDAVAWYDGNSGDKTHPVAQKRSNGLGLYDMSGNVWEWCHDWFGRSYYRNSPRNNPQGPSSGSVRVGRGGSWGDRAGGCRSALRLQVAPGNRYDILGFRLVLPAGQ
jgi:formylglycine-generating enzyme required for sulfatase activity